MTKQSGNKFDHKNFRDQRVNKFRNIHKEQKCIILGNGPSLNRTDLSLLDGEITIGLNKIFLLFDKFSFRPSYICCYVPNVVEQCRETYLNLEVPIFVSHESLNIIPPDYDHIFYFGPQHRFSFSQDLVNSSYGGFTVTYVAMQLALYMGFKKVILIGVDHDFGDYGEHSKWTKIEKPRGTHFDPNYFAVGQDWETPNLPMAEAHYRYAKEIYRFFNAEIIDSTIDGKLDVFTKISLQNALKK